MPEAFLLIHGTDTSPMLDTHNAFEAVGGYYRDEAIMLLRKFYMSENVNGE